MLTKSDLSQIQKVVNTETTKIVNVETKKIIVQELKPIKDDITHIRKDMKTIVNYFDKEYLQLRKRVERLENHLHLSPLYRN